MQYSIVNYNKLDDYCFRIDADYYMPIFLNYEKILLSNNCRKFDQFINVITDGKHGGVTFTEKGVLFIRNQNNKNGFLDLSNIKYISENESSETKRAELEYKDILLTTIGTIGMWSVIPKNFPRATINQNLVRIKTENINSYYLALFLGSSFGQNCITRLSAGNVQQIINYPNLKNISIPIFSDKFQLECQKIYLKSNEYRSNSNNLYKKSQSLLLSELGLNKWEPKHKLSYIKNFSDVEEAGRFDAEYFQPKYDEIVNAIKSYKGGWDVLSNQFKQNKKQMIIENDKNYEYIEIGSINVSTGELEPLFLTGVELPANAKIKLNKNDLIISKVRTYRGAVSIINKDGYIGSGAFTVLHEKDKTNIEILFILLKSKPFLEYSLKHNTGTSYPTLIDNDILNYPIPIFNKNIQNEIKNNVIEMNNSLFKSKSLLEIAKKSVEIAIEQDELTAKKWMNEEVEKLKVEL